MRNRFQEELEKEIPDVKNLLLKHTQDLSFPQGLTNVLKSMSDDAVREVFTYSIENGLVQAVKKMLKLRIINANDTLCDGSVPLYRAIRANNFQMVQLLLRHKANVNSIVEKDTLLLHALSVKNYKGDIAPNEDIVLELLVRGADPNIPKKSKGFQETALHLAARYNANAKIIKALIKHGANVNAKMKNNQTVLMEVARNCNSENMKILLNYKADVNCINCLGYTALYFAVQSKNFKNIDMKAECTRLLLKYGADLHVKYNENDEKGTILHVAVKCGQLKVIYSLLNFGCDINEPISKTDQTTALDCANEISNDSEGKKYQSIKIVLVRHLAIMKLCNMYVNDKDIQTINNDKLLRKCFDKCINNYSLLPEIQEMKIEKLSSQISMYDVFSQETRQVEMLVKNENVIQYFNSPKNYSKFLVFAPCLRQKIQMTVEMRNLHCKAKRSLAYSLHIFSKKDVPWKIVDKVLSYLSVEDLQALSKINLPPKLLSCLNICSNLYPNM